MINSSLLGVSTPQKSTIFLCQSPPKKIVYPERFAPTKTLMKSLVQIKRAHRFHFHEPLVCMSLEDINLTLSLGNTVIDFLADHDIPDSMMCWEELLVKQGCLNTTIRDYIAEEFNCDKEHSFPLVCVFMYMNQNQVGLNKAVEELFILPIKNTVCEECVGIEVIDKVKCSNYWNSKILQARRNLVYEESLNLSDDSVNDPDCILDKVESYTLSSNSQSTSSVQQGNVVSNPFLSPQKEQISNPFLSPCKSDIFDFRVSSPVSKKHELSRSFRFAPKFNSTASSPQHVKKGPTNICCEHCSKKFSNRNNMKQHLIR